MAATTAILIPVLAAGLSGCTGFGGGSNWNPGPIVTVTRSAPPVTPRESPSVTPSESPTMASVKATGSMSLFGDVSKKMVGTCGSVDGLPTLVLADHKNDFFGTVDVTIVLTAAKNGLASIAAQLGEDSEGITRELTYDSAAPAKGTSAKFKATGNTYKMSGKAKVVENDEGAKTTSVIPFSITAACVNANW